MLLGWELSQVRENIQVFHIPRISGIVLRVSGCSHGKFWFFLLLLGKPLLNPFWLNLNLLSILQLPSLGSSLGYEVCLHKQSLPSFLPYTVCFRHTWPLTFSFKILKILADGIDSSFHWYLARAFITFSVEICFKGSTGASRFHQPMRDNWPGWKIYRPPLGDVIAVLPESYDQNFMTRPFKVAFLKLLCVYTYTYKIYMNSFNHSNNFIKYILLSTFYLSRN